MRRCSRSFGLWVGIRITVRSCFSLLLLFLIRLGWGASVISFSVKAITGTFADMLLVDYRCSLCGLNFIRELPSYSGGSFFADFPTRFSGDFFFLRCWFYGVAADWQNVPVSCYIMRALWSAIEDLADDWFFLARFWLRESFLSSNVVAFFLCFFLLLFYTPIF